MRSTGPSLRSVGTTNCVATEGGALCTGPISEEDETFHSTNRILIVTSNSATSATLVDFYLLEILLFLENFELQSQT